MSLGTGYTRDYREGAAYRDYYATDDLMFQVPELDTRLGNKDEVLGLVLPAYPDRPLAIAAAFLVANPGLNSGFMIVQYTAAALVSENKVLCHPASVDSIPTSANKEDHVSMGANAARHTIEILENLRHIVAIELLSAAQAVDLRETGPNGLAPLTRTVYDKIRSRVRFLEHDRALTPDIEAIADLVRSNAVLADVREH